MPDSEVPAELTEEAAVLEKLPFFALALAGSVITYSVQQSGGALWSPNALPLIFALANALMAYLALHFQNLLAGGFGADLSRIPIAGRSLAVSSALMLVLWYRLLIFWRARRIRICSSAGSGFWERWSRPSGLCKWACNPWPTVTCICRASACFMAVVWGLNDLVTYRPRRKLVALAAVALAGCLVVTSASSALLAKQPDPVFSQAVAVTTDNYAA